MSFKTVVLFAQKMLSPSMDDRDREEINHSYRI